MFIVYDQGLTKVWLHFLIFFFLTGFLTCCYVCWHSYNCVVCCVIWVSHNVPPLFLWITGFCKNIVRCNLYFNDKQNFAMFFLENSCLRWICILRRLLPCISQSLHKRCTQLRTVARQANITWVDNSAHTAKHQASATTQDIAGHLISRTHRTARSHLVCEAHATLRLILVSFLLLDHCLLFPSPLSTSFLVAFPLHNGHWGCWAWLNYLLTQLLSWCSFQRCCSFVLHT